MQKLGKKQQNNVQNIFNIFINSLGIIEFFYVNNKTKAIYILKTK